MTGSGQRTGKPRAVAEVRRDRRYIGITERVVSEIAVPLISEGRVIGVFNLESTHPASRSQLDLHVLPGIHSHATNLSGHVIAAIPVRPRPFIRTIIHDAAINLLSHNARPDKV